MKDWRRSMAEESFNLLTSPWIKVIGLDSDEEKQISLGDLFQNAQNYRRLAGEMRSQDLAILRFLLAILTTVYTRFDANGNPYEWLELDSKSWRPIDNSLDDDTDDIQEDLLATWEDLFQRGSFSDIVVKYLGKYAARFDVFGKQPFYQVTAEIYDDLTSKKIASGKGTVAIKQMNRLISESNNSPDIFSPKSSSQKNKIGTAEFVRWLISYQNFTGTTDKTKIKGVEKYSASAGWLYGLDTVYAQGKTLFETLMLNLVLISDFSGEYGSIIQKPNWEFASQADYVKYLLEKKAPDNIAGLYTNWSRMIYVRWDDEPTVFSTCLPKFDDDAINNEIEPMTTWRVKDRHHNTKHLSDLGKKMWRNFGLYVPTEADTQNADMKPGIVNWLSLLKDEQLIPDAHYVNLATANLISDGNATSQLPAAEISDDLYINADILFDLHWTTKIEDAIEYTQQIIKYYWGFANGLAELRGIGDKRDFANRLSEDFYNRLNEPFNNWLIDLDPMQPTTPQILKWEDEVLLRQVDEQVNAVMATASPKEIIGDHKGKDEGSIKNIFILVNILRASINKYRKKLR